jgi:hypothetical protein
MENMPKTKRFNQEELESEITWLHSMCGRSCITSEDAEKIAKEIIISKRQWNKNKMKGSEFIQGVVSALDIVALHGEGQVFKEIVEASGKEATISEVMKNGLEKTKEMAQIEFKLR